MGIHYENLDETTQSHMLEESRLGGHYISPRLSEQGQTLWPSLLEESIALYIDDWLAAELLRRKLVRPQETYIRAGVTRERSVNQPHAAQQLAEGEFNRYYLRGLCMRAKASGIPSVIIYRGKPVAQPRPESEAKIGSKINVDMLLGALRTNDFVAVEAAIGVPGGPNSGLTARLP